MRLLLKSPIRFLKRVLWWLLATARWVWEVNPLWIPFVVAVLICVLVSVVWPCPVEREVRLMGMFLQLLGVITIVMRLRAAQRQFPGQTLKLWWERRPRFRVRNIIVSAAGSAMSMATGRARLSITPGPQATLEQRVAMLEDSYTNLSGEVGGLGNEMRQRGDELSNKLHAEVAAREASDKKIEEQLKETAVGSLHLDAWGVVFFVIGIIAGTVSPEIAGWVGSGSCG